MRYIIYGIVFSILIGIGGCSYPKVVRVPKPIYPTMSPVVITNGTITGHNVKNVVDNMLGMSELIDNLYLCPCWEE